MADVKINIPGVGEVVATNAASEETLTKILAVMDKSSKDAKKQDSSQGIFKNMVKDYQSQKKAADEYEKSLAGLTKEQKKALAAEREVALSQLKFERALLGGVQAVSAITGTIGSLGKSVIGLGVQMATSYDEMAKNPIGAAAGQVNTFISMANTAVKGAADASAGVAHAFGGIPIVGPIISGLGDAAAAATKGMADLAAAVLHTANDVMAKEFQKSATALDVYTKQGASFANGMLEMRTIANDAGLSLTLLQDAAKNSRQELRESGLSQGDAVKVLAKGMLSAKDTIGKSGASLRNEMLALGYNYQEQGEIMAQYMAQQRSAGENLKNIAPAELARGAREYAQNLKIISDITGEDAKKLMEKAKAQAMEADLMAEAYAKGGPEAVKKLQAQLATMPEAMKKGYMEFVSTGGTAIADAATNVAITQNPKIMEQYRQQYETLGDANKKQQDALIESGKLTEQTGKYAREHLEDTRTLAMAGRLSGDGQLQAVSTLNNSLIMAGAKLEEGTTQASKDASDAQAKLAASANSLESNFASITKTMQDNAVRMEELAGEHLEEYGEILKRTADATAEAFDKAIKFINSGFDVASLTAKPGDEENRKQLATAAADYKKAFEGGGFFQKFFQIGMTESQSKANDKYNKAGEANVQQTGADYFSNIPQFDGGGIASGPTTGFLSMLHGNELVLPLQADGTIKTGTDGYKAIIDKFSNASAGLSTTQLKPQSQDISAQMLDLVATFIGSATAQSKQQATQSQDISAQMIDLAKTLTPENFSLALKNIALKDMFKDTFKDLSRDITTQMATAGTKFTPEALASTFKDMFKDLSQNITAQMATTGTKFTPEELSGTFKDMSLNMSRDMTAQIADTVTKFNPADFSLALKDITNPMIGLNDMMKQITETDRAKSKVDAALGDYATKIDKQKEVDAWQIKQYEIMEVIAKTLMDQRDIAQKLLYAST